MKSKEMRLFEYVAKRQILIVIAMLSIPISVMGLGLTHFWCSVICDSGDYAKNVFEVNEIKRVRYGAKIRYELAMGKVAGADEVLYGWRDYFKTKAQKLDSSGKRVPVMYNPKASEFSYAGRNLRVLSIKQFTRAKYWLLQSLALVAVAPTLWFVYVRYHGGARVH